MSRLSSALPPPPSALTWVAGKRLAEARHGSPLGTHFLAPRSAAAHLAEAPPSPGLAWRLRASWTRLLKTQVPSPLYDPESWKSMESPWSAYQASKLLLKEHGSWDAVPDT